MSVTLTYPYTSPTTTLVIRSPKFGDIRAVDHQLLLGRNRGGKVLPYKDANWPTFRVLKMKWEALTDAEANSFIQFFKDASAAEIGFLDWNSDQYRGLIKNPVTQIIQHGQASCTKEIELDFIGVLV
jgi:hypothetical protein